MTLTGISTSFILTLLTDFIVMVGAISFFYWINAPTAAPFVVARQHLLASLTGAGFVIYLLARMVSTLHGQQIPVTPYWSDLNLLVITSYLLNLQLGWRWQALVDAGLLALCYLIFGAPWSLIGGLAVVVAAGALYWTQTQHNTQRRLYRYSGLIVLAVAVLTLVSQFHLGQYDSQFWLRQTGALLVLGALCLAFDQLMYATRQRTDKMHTLTTIDELTGVHNFGTFNQKLDDLFAKFQKDGQPYSVFEGDLDHFKQINDTYGHLSGNAVLRQLALELDAFADTLPFPATAYRLGGEEFAIVACAPINHQQAMEIGERFLKLLTLVRFPDADPNLTITCSIGQAHVEKGDYSANDVYKKADRNLYAAKQNGRNRVHAQ